MYKGCKLCWDKTGKIVKKYCPKQSSNSKYLTPGCKLSGKCKICWDKTGKIVKKYCP